MDSLLTHGCPLAVALAEAHVAFLLAAVSMLDSRGHGAGEAMDGTEGPGRAAREIAPRDGEPSPLSPYAVPQRAHPGQTCAQRARVGLLEELDLGGRASARPSGSVHRFWWRRKRSMLSRSRTRARSFMRPPQWGHLSTGRPRVRRINSAQRQYRQRGPVRGGVGGGLVCADGTGGVSVGGGSGSGGMTRGRHGLAGAKTPL